MRSAHPRTAALIGLTFAAGQALAAHRPNIVLIMADDMDHVDFDCYDPHLDRLAELSV